MSNDTQTQEATLEYKSQPQTMGLTFYIDSPDPDIPPKPVAVPIDLVIGIGRTLLGVRLLHSTIDFTTSEGQQQASYILSETIGSCVNFGLFFAAEEQRTEESHRIAYTMVDTAVAYTNAVVGDLWNMLLKEDWKTVDDPVLSATYHLLNRKFITREHAFKIAQDFARSVPVSSVDGWRKRIDRWAKPRGLTQIGQTKRQRRAH